MGNQRQNYHQDTEAAVNRLINLQQKAANAFLTAYGYYSRSEVALNGFANFFYKLHNISQCRVKQLIDYQNIRGGEVMFFQIPVNESFISENVLEMVTNSTNFKRNEKQSFLELVDVAQSHKDPEVANFILKIIEKVNNEMMFLADLETKINRAGSGLGEQQISFQLPKLMKKLDK